MFNKILDSQKRAIIYITTDLFKVILITQGENHDELECK